MSMTGKVLAEYSKLRMEGRNLEAEAYHRGATDAYREATESAVRAAGVIIDKETLRQLESEVDHAG
jgi:hypothetical protein